MVAVPEVVMGHAALEHDVELQRGLLLAECYVRLCVTKTWARPLSQQPAGEEQLNPTGASGFMKTWHVAVEVQERSQDADACFRAS